MTCDSWYIGVASIKQGHWERVPSTFVVFQRSFFTRHSVSKNTHRVDMTRCLCILIFNQPQVRGHPPHHRRFGLANILLSVAGWSESNRYPGCSLLYWIFSVCSLTIASSTKRAVPLLLILTPCTKIMMYGNSQFNIVQSDVLAESRGNVTFETEWVCNFRQVTVG